MTAELTSGTQPIRARIGFTLIEVVVVLTVLGVMIAAVTPNLVATIKSGREHTFLNQLTALGTEAREKAISSAAPVDLEYDATGNQFRIHGTNPAGGDVFFSSLSVPATLQVDRFILAGKDSDPNSWKLFFYPDGTTDGGGAQLSGSQTDIMSLYVDAGTGLSQLLHDKLPDTTTLTWPAGDIVHRATS